MSLSWVWVLSFVPVGALELFRDLSFFVFFISRVRNKTHFLSQSIFFINTFFIQTCLLLNIFVWYFLFKFCFNNICLKKKKLWTNCLLRKEVWQNKVFVGTCFVANCFEKQVFFKENICLMKLLVLIFKIFWLHIYTFFY